MNKDRRDIQSKLWALENAANCGDVGSALLENGLIRKGCSFDRIFYT
jgi:hypothetical protein